MTREMILQAIRRSYRLINRAVLAPVLAFRGNHVKRNATIEWTALLVRCQVGEYAYVGHHVVAAHAVIGRYCSIGAGAKIGGMEHSWWWASTSPAIANFGEFGKVTHIEEDVWLGANATIRQGVHVGRGAVIAAGAVVLADVSRYEVVAGVPARHIRMRFQEETIARIEQTSYWQCEPMEARRRLLMLGLPTSRPSRTAGGYER